MFNKGSLLKITNYLQRICDEHFKFMITLFIINSLTTAWSLFDEEKGYHSCSYLGRIARTSDQLSDEENDLEVERAIDEIVRYDFRNIYKKVTRDAVAI